MSEWQPIETAPKDGTSIDVWAKKFDVRAAGKVIIEEIGRTADARWSEEVHVYTSPYERKEGDKQWVRQGGLMDWEPIEYGSIRVTHWMPLPEPPKACKP